MISQSFRNIYFARLLIALVILFLISLIPRQGNIPSLLSSLSVPDSASTQASTNHPRWLLAIFLSPSKISRRAIIRSTWAARYQNFPYEYRFIIGNYSSSPWASTVEAENATYGDIWAIDDFMNESAQTANKNKNMEFFKYLVQYQGTRLRKYDFVSKVDDDIWFNIPPYYETFIAPRLPGGEECDPSALTMIGRPMVWNQDYAYASGRIYTLSWPLVEFYAEKYTTNPVVDKTEDELAGHYLYEDKIPVSFVPLELEQAWDIGLEYLVDDETIIIHGVKHDERLLKISTMFNSDGRWNGKTISGLTSFDRTMDEVIERIGQPSEEELAQLRMEEEEGKGEQQDDDVDNNNKSSHKDDPWESLDWKLIEAKIGLEDRERMGDMYPLSLPGNNVSSGVVPRPLYLGKRPS